MSPRVCVDFDGVLNSYKSWRGPTEIDDPVPGAQEFMRALIAAGLTPVVLTTRAESPEGRKAIFLWMERHGFPSGILVTNQNVAATLYVDDRGFRFEGDFDAVLRFIKHHGLGTWQRPDTSSSYRYGGIL